MSPRQHLTNDGKLVSISLYFYQIILSSYLIKFWIPVCCYKIEKVLEKAIKMNIRLIIQLYLRYAHYFPYFGFALY